MLVHGQIPYVQRARAGLLGAHHGLVAVTVRRPVVEGLVWHEVVRREVVGVEGVVGQGARGAGGEAGWNLVAGTLVGTPEEVGLDLVEDGRFGGVLAEGCL